MVDSEDDLVTLNKPLTADSDKQIEVLAIKGRDGWVLQQDGKEYTLSANIKSFCSDNLTLILKLPMEYEACLYSNKTEYGDISFEDISEEICAKAENHGWQTISLFGREEAIKNIDVAIVSSAKHNGFRFDAYLAKNGRYWEDSINIRICVSPEKFKKILTMWKINKIKQARVTLNASIINGFYKGGYYYKVLANKKIIKNQEQLTEAITDTNTMGHFYETKEGDDTYKIRVFSADKVDKFTLDEEEIPEVPAEKEPQDYNPILCKIFYVLVFFLTLLVLK